MSEHTLHSCHPADTAAPTIAIIGGGLTGLFTATLLERAFGHTPAAQPMPQLTIFEKSRSVGRLATRYRRDSQTHKNWQWAFGAQFFTAKTASFQQFIAPWLDMGTIQPWCANVVEMTAAHTAGQRPSTIKKERWNTEQARYISTPKMTSWGRALAGELQHTTMRFQTRVAPLAQYTEPAAGENKQQTKQKTELFDEAGHSLGLFDWVICTAPNVQAGELMAGSGFDKQESISTIKMQACYTLMLGWDEGQALPAALTDAEDGGRWDVAYVNDSIIDRIFIEQRKPAHETLLPSITIHARNDWSEQQVDEEIGPVQAALLTAAQHALGWDDTCAPTQIDCHRWRYAATRSDAQTPAQGVLTDASRQWIVSGDWCGQGNIESCYHMAQQTAEVICAALAGRCVATP